MTEDEYEQFRVIRSRSRVERMGLDNPLGMDSTELRALSEGFGKAANATKVTGVAAIVLARPIGETLLSLATAAEYAQELYANAAIEAQQRDEQEAKFMALQEKNRMEVERKMIERHKGSSDHLDRGMTSRNDIGERMDRLKGVA